MTVTADETPANKPLLDAVRLRGLAPPFLRTTTFRLVLVHAGLFLAFALSLLAYVYYTTAGRLTLNAGIDAQSEFEALRDLYLSDGMERLNQAVIERSTGPGPLLYVLADPNGRVISGDFDALPRQPQGPAPSAGADAAEGVAAGRPRLSAPAVIENIDFAFQQPGENGALQRRQAIGRMSRVGSGWTLLVARDLGDDDATVRQISNVVWLGGFVGLLLSLAGGVLVAGQAARRASELSRTARDVMRGDLARRAPVSSVGDEFDDLGQALNQMLGRIENLVQGARHAGDAIAHDLRSPLTRLKGRLEQALSEASNDAERRAAIEGAMDDADALLETFNALHKLSRLQDPEQWALKPIDATGLAHEMAELFGPAAEDAGLVFTTDIEDGLIVNGDHSLLAQALANLLDNAIKYTPAGAEVAVAARTLDDGMIELAISDHGPGIPEDQRERVRNRFVRLESARSTPGAGLGLSLTSAVAEVHRGELMLADAHPETPDRPGLRASLVLPPVQAASS
jgi:signal transduction histidine kinase